MSSADRGDQKRLKVVAGCSGGFAACRGRDAARHRAAIAAVQALPLFQDRLDSKLAAPDSDCNLSRGNGNLRARTRA